MNKFQVDDKSSVALPCPFCNSSNIEFKTFDYKESCRQDTESAAMECQGCGAMGGTQFINIMYKDGSVTNDYAKIKEECEKAWNDRGDQEIEIKYFVKITDYQYTTCGGSGRGTYDEYFETADAAKKFIEDMRDSFNFAEFSEKECGHNGHIEKIGDTVYMKKTIIETIK